MKITRLLLDIYRHPSNKGRRFLAITKSILFKVRTSISSKDFSLGFHNMKLMSHKGNKSTSSTVYFSGLPDYWEMKFIGDYLRKGDIVLDIGANAGVYSIYMADLVGPNGQVESFEPNSDTVLLLRENLETNSLKNVRIHPLGCSNTSGTVGFNLTSDANTAHITVDESKNAEVEIQTIRLDDHLKEENFSFAKLDIEGSEPFAVRGMKKWMNKNNPPVLLIEMAGLANRFNITTSEFIEELNQLSYETFTYDVDKKSLIPGGNHWERGEQNVLVISMDRIKEVESRLEESSISH